MLFILQSYKDYLEGELRKGKVSDLSYESDKIGNAKMIILLGLITNIIIGVYIYWGDNKPEDTKGYDFMEFIMGTPKCKKSEGMMR